MDTSDKVLAYLPIDIPKIDLNLRLIKFFETNCKTHIENSSSKKSELDRVMELWDLVTLRTSQLAIKEGNPSSWYKYDPSDTSWLWNHSFEELFPDLVKHLSLLPFRYITYVALFRNKAVIPLHRDRLHLRDSNGQMAGHLNTSLQNNPQFNFYKQQIQDIEPCSYRLILSGAGDQSFRVSPSLRSEDAVNGFLPNSTQCFVFNNSRCYHGANQNPSGKILMYISGFLDKRKHQKLIDKSLSRYGRQAIWFKKNDLQSQFNKVPLETVQ